MWLTNYAADLKSQRLKPPALATVEKLCSKILLSLTGGTVISEDLGIKLEDVNLKMLGTAKHVTITKDDTIVVDGAGKKKDIKARVAQIRKQAEDTTSDYDKEKLQERLAKLSGGVAVIKVGGSALKSKSKSAKTALMTRLTPLAPLLKKASYQGAALRCLRATRFHQRQRRK